MTGGELQDIEMHKILFAISACFSIVIMKGSGMLGDILSEIHEMCFKFEKSVERERFGFLIVYIMRIATLDLIL